MDFKKAIGRVSDSMPGRVGRKFIEDQSPNWAILIAWNALFSMFPILLIVLAVLGLIVGGHESSGVVQSIVKAFPDQSMQKSILSGLQGVHHSSGIFFIVGLLGLLWGGSALFGTMDMAFAVLYHTKQRDFLPQKLMATGMIALFTLLALLSVVTSSALPALKHIAGSPAFLHGGPLSFLIQIIIGVVSGLLLFGAIYFVVPNRRQEFTHIWPGALAAGILFELISLLFPLYLALNKGINQYGSFFALFFVMLMFFYFFGLITLLGVEVNAVLFSVPVEQPSHHGEPGRTAVSAPPQSGPEGEGKYFGPRPVQAPGQSARPQPVAAAGEARIVDTRLAASAQNPADRAQQRQGATPLLVLGSIVVGFVMGRRASPSS
jgi:membrane protein